MQFLRNYCVDQVQRVSIDLRLLKPPLCINKILNLMTYKVYNHTSYLLTQFFGFLVDASISSRSSSIFKPASIYSSSFGKILKSFFNSKSE